MSIRKVLSPSQIDTFRKCPAGWKRQYLDRQREPETSGLIVGRAVHKGMEFVNKRRMTGDPTTYDDVIRAYADAFAEEAVNVQVWQRPREVEQQRGLDMLTRLVNATKGDVPAAAEERFSVPFGYGDWKLNGVVDVRFPDGRLTDYKTANNPWNERKKDEQLQHAFYSHAFRHTHGELPTGFTFLVVSAQPVLVTPFLMDVNEKEVERAINLAVGAAREIERGNFPRGPICRYCPLGGKC